MTEPHTDMMRALTRAATHQIFEEESMQGRCPRPLNPPLTELGNSERFVREWGQDVRYCHTTGAWFVWDGRRFKLDTDAEVVRRAKKTVRNIYREAADSTDEKQRTATADWARKSERAAQIASMLNLAESDAVMSVTADRLDSNDFLLNVENGTLDLKTGRLRPHDRADLLTKLAPVDYNERARCPRWERFLAEAFGPHPDVIPLLQVAAGYSLTGDVREECLFLQYGTGRNGKGTLTHVLATMLGEYAGTADFQTFVNTTNDRGPRDDIAAMKGKRFVSAQESREGSAFAESVVKWLTGGDVVRARQLYERGFEFRPTFKLWLSTNHKPVIRGTDPAIWSRIKLIPYEVSFEGREDRGLKAALLSELPGVLAWAVEGCRRWREEGLVFPESVTAATAEYRAESDRVGRFITESCVKGTGCSALGGELFTAYKRWCEQTGETPMNGTAFGNRLKELGHTKRLTSRGVRYDGLGLRAASEGYEGS